MPNEALRYCATVPPVSSPSFSCISQWICDARCGMGMGEAKTPRDARFTITWSATALETSLSEAMARNFDGSHPYPELMHEVASGTGSLLTWLIAVAPPRSISHSVEDAETTVGWATPCLFFGKHSSSHHPRDLSQWRSHRSPCPFLLFFQEHVSRQHLMWSKARKGLRV